MSLAEYFSQKKKDSNSTNSSKSDRSRRSSNNNNKNDRSKSVDKNVINNEDMTKEMNENTTNTTTNTNTNTTTVAASDHQSNQDVSMDDNNNDTVIFENNVNSKDSSSRPTTASITISNSKPVHKNDKVVEEINENDTNGNGKTIIMNDKNVEEVVVGDQVNNKDDNNHDKEEIVGNANALEYSDESKKYSEQLHQLAIGKGKVVLYRRRYRRRVHNNHIQNTNDNSSTEKENHTQPNCSTSSSIMTESKRNEMEQFGNGVDAEKCSNQLSQIVEKNTAVEVKEKEDRSEMHHGSINRSCDDDVAGSGGGNGGSALRGNQRKKRIIDTSITQCKDPSLINEDNNLNKISDECQGLVDGGNLKNRLNVLQSKVGAGNEGAIRENQGTKKNSETTFTECNGPGSINDQNNVNTTNGGCQDGGSSLKGIDFLSRMDTLDKAFKQVNNVQCLNKRTDRLGSKSPNTTEVTITERGSNTTPKVSGISNTNVLPITDSDRSETVTKRINDGVSKLQKAKTSSGIDGISLKKHKNQQPNDQNYDDHAVVRADIHINTAKGNTSRQRQKEHTPGHRNLVGENDTKGKMTAFTLHSDNIKCKWDTYKLFQLFFFCRNRSSDST